MLKNLLLTLHWYLRPFIKWFLRRTTNLCELQRICYGDKVGAARTCNVERSLKLSRTKSIIESVGYLDTTVLQRKFIPLYYEEILDPVINIILRVKNVNPKLHRPFVKSLSNCMQYIWSYKLLVNDVEDLRKIQYDSDNIEHEEKLLKLWLLLIPDIPLESRVTNQWQHIGFQGDDPKTDFRGMGLLGLENLLFFAEEYQQASRHVLSHSHHPRFGYFFAIVGINITSMAYHLLKDGLAKTYMYSKRHVPNIELFHRFYCYLFYEFDKLWIQSKPKDIMEFSIIFKNFENFVKAKLSDPASVFRIDIEVETI